MNRSGILNGILIGLIVVLVGVILLQDSNRNPVLAEEQGGADNPRGVGMAANGIIAVTGQYSADTSVLFLIDTNREVLLTYGCYSKTSTRGSGQFNKPVLTYLNGRTYTWDGAYAQKAVYGDYEKASPWELRERLKKGTTEEGKD